MNGRISHLIAGWRTGLPRPVLILQAGNALNYFGYGLILPFEIIYLHQFRGLSTSTAGLVLAAIMGTAAIVTPPAGALLDRYSAKAMVVAGSLASALGYAGFAFVELPWQAFACSIVSGAGIGLAGTASRVLIIRLVARDQRPASFALARVAGNFGLGLGATAAGFLVASAQQLGSFQALYVGDGLTYAGFALVVLLAVPIPRAEIDTASAADGAGFRAVARDRLFAIVIAANIVLLVTGHVFFSNILAPFAEAHTAVGPAGFGIIFLVNTAMVVIAQIPAVRVVTRMRRGAAFLLASGLFAVGLLAVLPATLIPSELAATSLLAGVGFVLAIGECFHIVVLGPLVADMAPAHLLGRYLAVFGLSFTVSLTLGPAIGGLLLQIAPDAVWWGGAVAALLAGAVLFRLGDRIPDPLRAAQSTGWRDAGFASRLGRSRLPSAVGGQTSRDRATKGQDDRPAATSRSTAMTMRLIGAAVLGLILGIGATRFPSLQWATLIPWALGGLAAGALCRGRREALAAGAAYGFILGFAFMITSYGGADPIVGKFPFFAVIGLVSAAAGAVAAFVGYWRWHEWRRSNRTEGAR